MSPNRPPFVKRNVVILVMVCTLSAMAGWGLAYYRFCSKSAAIERAELERQKADAATPSIFAEGDKIPLPKECVYGHNTLKDVQIIWGHPWDLDELREKVERHEVVLSGTDVIGPKAKSHTVYCPVCDFTLEMGYGPWTRTSKDAASFVQPFSVLVTSFPLPEEVESLPVRYTQEVMHRVVFGERLVFVTRESLAEMKGRVSKWAERHELILTPETLPELRPYRLYPSGPLIIEQNQIWNAKASTAVSGMIHFASYPEKGTVMVWLSTNLKRDVMISIDEALLRKRTRSEVKDGPL